MFPLQPSDELVFGTPTTSERDQIRYDLIADRAFMDSNLISFSSTSNNRQLGQTTNFGFQNRPTQTREEHSNNNWRVMHRDVERKRRREMTDLHVSLRSLLPRQHIKGKPSVCDQMQQALNHIKQLEKNIQELTIRRDKLQTLSGTKEESSDGSDDLANCVTVNFAHDGLEILISRSITSSKFGLSEILAELLQRELDVVSCLSTRSKGKLLHKIQTAAQEMMELDVSALQDRLTNIIN